MTRSAGHRGFSFVELMFAVAVLSIGVMGVAGALYVGVDQTRSTLDESTAAAVARAAQATLAQVMTRDNTPVTGDAFARIADQADGAPFLPDVVKPAQVSLSDPRFAWMPVYRRIKDAPTAEVLIVVVRATTRSAYDARDTTSYEPPLDPQYRPTLVPQTISVDITDNQLTVNADGPTGICAGALVVLSQSTAAMNGRVLRIGDQVGPGVWSLAPGQDMADVPGTVTAGNAYLFGQAYADVDHPDRGYAGPSQAVSVYSAIVLLR